MSYVSQSFGDWYIQYKKIVLFADGLTDGTDDTFCWCSILFRWPYGWHWWYCCTMNAVRWGALPASHSANFCFMGRSHKKFSILLQAVIITITDSTFQIFHVSFHKSVKSVLTVHDWVILIEMNWIEGIKLPWFEWPHRRLDGVSIW